MAREDAKQLTQLSGGKLPLVFMAVGIVGLLAAGVLVNLTAYAFAALAGAAGLASLLLGVWQYTQGRRQTAAIVEKYGTADWKQWTVPIAEFEQAVENYSEELKTYQEVTSDLEVRLMVLRKRRDSLCGLQEPEEVLEFWQQAQRQWESCEQSRREAALARQHYEALSAMVRPVEKPAFQDNLTQNEAETANLLAECAAEQQRLQNRLGQYQGRMEILGSPQELGLQRKRVADRIARLEETYEALTIALDTLSQARSSLQRRFRPPNHPASPGNPQCSDGKPVSQSDHGGGFLLAGGSRAGGRASRCHLAQRRHGGSAVFVFAAGSGGGADPGGSAGAGRCPGTL